ncbi:MAG: choice-of-anchor J domain-containing protein, partial [Candidatus Cloacimonetes bacterium]|nr:choice-of-anchor J domain-containing protein [Candidatus Cloacimonadota bacterium]
MKTSLNKLMLLLIFSVVAFGAWATVSEYTFASSIGTYTEITGGTVLGTNLNDDESFNAIDLGFTFNYNGTDYTQVSIQTDAFLAFGPEVTNSTLAISSSTGTNNVIAAFNRDLKSRDNGELMYMLGGSAPNRIFTVQWKNYRRIPTSCETDVFNFQIQLHENGDEIVYAYGSFNAVNATTAQTVQVGLRGDDNTDFNNRTTTTDWTDTAAGTANNASCRINATVYPPNGLLFTFAPPQQGTPPFPAQNPVPADYAMDVAAGTNLSWISGGGTVDGYKLYFGTDTPPTNLVNGTVQTEAEYDHPTDLSFSTTYYWKVVPFNTTGGDALDCPVWQFSTLADPTVNTYPYVQDFDDVTPPALPLGWSSVNANADPYTWETYAGNAQTDPNSIRIRYNPTLEMNDWLIAPPLSLTMDTTYIIEFSYRANSETYPEALSLYWGTAGAPAGLTNLLFENTNIINTTYEQEQLTFTPPADGIYFLGFHGHSSANQFYLYLDSFSIEENVDSMDPPTNLAAEVINNDYVSLTWTAPGDTPPPGFNDGFETYADFALTFDPWMLLDVDQSTTYGMTGITWPNAYAAQAYMIFNPSATTPPVTDAATHGGSKMAACFASTTPPNNDWLISPLVTPAAGDFLNFYAKSYTAQYGLERFKVGVSTGGTTPADFTIISGASYVQAPVDWTQYSYDLSAYAGQQIRFGIQCVSNDAFIFFVDDVTVGPVPVAKGHYAYHDQAGTNTRATGIPVPAPQILDPPTREFLGYKIYRDGSLLTTIDNTATTSYEDHDVTVGTYSYTITAVYTAGESVPAGPVTATINPPNNPPTDLSATVDGNDVTLNWVSPEPPQTGEWITWCQDVLGNGIGTNSAIVFDVAHRFDQTDLAPHQGGTITQVKFVPNYADCVYTVKVWTGGSASGAGTLVSSQVVPDI